MQPTDRMSEDELRRHRRRVERMKRERRRVRRNRIILGVVLGVLVLILLICIIKNTGSNNDTKKATQKETTVQVTEEVTEKTEDTGLNDKYANLDTSNLTVCIDPGHGGKDPGVEANNHTEKDDTLAVSLKVKEILDKYGVNVTLTRDDDTFLYLNPRSQVANDNAADVFVSIHRTEDEKDAQTNGIEIYIDKDATDDTLALSKFIRKRLKKAGDMSVAKVAYGSAGDEDTNYVVIDGVEMPACLISLGYVTNDGDNTSFDDDMNKYAKAIAEGILNYFLDKQDSAQ
jgi:N-acetylmuramoyl-L-alanine amidase